VHSAATGPNTPAAGPHWPRPPPTFAGTAPPANPLMPRVRTRPTLQRPPPAAPQLLQLSEAYSSRRQLEEEEGIIMPPWVIHPYDVRAHFWWAFIALVRRRGGPARARGRGWGWEGRRVMMR
jgi:hypothetical protein